MADTVVPAGSTAGSTPVADGTERTRVYLIDNLDLFEIKKGVSVKLFVTRVPSGCVLVHRGPFQEDIADYKLMKPGIHMMKPFSQRKLYIDRGLPIRADVAPFECHDSNNWSIPKVDFSLDIKLVDPVKFSYNDNVDRMDQRVLYVLNDTFCSVVKKFTRSRAWDDIAAIFSGTITKGMLDVDGTLSAFESRCGIEITGIYLQGLKRPKEVEAMAAVLQENKVAAERNKRRVAEARAEGESKKLVAEGEARAEELTGAAQAKSAKKMIGAGVSADSVGKAHEYRNLPKDAHVIVSPGGSTAGSGTSDLVRDAMLLRSVLGGGAPAGPGAPVSAGAPAGPGGAVIGVPDSSFPTSPQLDEYRNLLRQGLVTFSPASQDYRNCMIILTTLSNNIVVVNDYLSHPAMLQQSIDDLKAKINSHASARTRRP